MIEQIQGILAWTPGPLELTAILVVAVLLFGRRLPEIARGMGKSLTEFKKGLKETKDDIEKPADSSEEQPKETTQQDSKQTD
jgi:sec-independent protein translocase protein TatA